MDLTDNQIQIKNEPPSLDQGWVPAYEGKFYYKVMNRMAQNFIRMGFEVYVQLVGQKENINETMKEMEYKFFLRGNCSTNF